MTDLLLYLFLISLVVIIVATNGDKARADWQAYKRQRRINKAMRK